MTPPAFRVPIMGYRVKFARLDVLHDSMFHEAILHVEATAVICASIRPKAALTSKEPASPLCH